MAEGAVRMLNRPVPRPYIYARQKGVVLVIALIVLVAMTLAGIALVRSIDTTNIIAGNLAFQQAATHSADSGVESAIEWLSTTSAATLENTDTSRGYRAAAVNPTASQTGAQYWQALLDSGVSPCALPFVAGNCNAAATPDTAGNSISYIVQRLCRIEGNKNGAGCASTTSSVLNVGNSEASGEDTFTKTTAVFYQINVRVDGPRNTVSYIQAVVSM